MTSRERVLSVFAHEIPDQVPRWSGASWGFWEKAKRTLGLDDEQLIRRVGDDFRRVNAGYRPTEAQAINRPLFGVERAGLGYGQPVSHPLAEATLHEVHAYPWPDAAWVDASGIRAQAAQWQQQYAVLGGMWSPFWHDAIDLLGMENLFLTMYDEPEIVDAVLMHIVDFYVEASRRIFAEASEVIDIFFIGNDFGSQTGPLMNVDLFSRFMLPHLQRLINLGHDYGLLVQLHCCGGFTPLIPSMIHAGLDALHAIQPCCQGMDLATLKAHFGDEIVFNGCIDSQHVLIDGPSPEYVRQQTRDVLHIMAPGGGYIAGASHDSILEETPVENVLAMFDAIGEFGVYGG